MTASRIELVDVHQRYPRAETPTLTDLNLELPAGTITALLGPSGCGKSTLLAIIAGLLPAGGQVLLDGADISGVASERRAAGVVFQRPLLFPHLSVLENVAFGLRRRGMRRSVARRRAAELLELVGLAELRARRPEQLSGGQAQRVALARALAPEPRMLLLDEPLSALDPAVRARMRELIRHIQRDLQVTTLFITHDQTEAAEVADRIALLLDGRIAQLGTAADLHLRPASSQVAAFMGNPTLVPGHNEAGIVRCPLGQVAVPSDAPRGEVLLVVADSAVVADPRGSLSAIVVDTHDLGTSIRLRLRAADGIDLVTHLRPGTSMPTLGSSTTVTLDQHALWTVPAGHQRATVEAPTTSHSRSERVEHN